MLISVSRRLTRPLLPLMLLVLLAVPLAAQDDSGRTLQPGQPLVGQFDENNIAHVYTFNGLGGGSVQVSATSIEGFPLALLLTDVQGQTVAQARDLDGSGTVSLPAVELPQTSVYYVTVFPAPGQDSAPTGAFVVTLISTAEGGVAAPAAEPAPPVAEEETASPVEEEAAPEEEQPAADTGEVTFQPPVEILLPGGLQVSLSWNTTADLNLQVRDPTGESLYWDSRTTSSGGVFGFDANGLCEILTTTPVERANWNPGPVWTGSYEILVYYRQECQSEGPVDFTVDVTVNGVALNPIVGRLSPPLPGRESVHIARFEVDREGNGEVESGGVYPGINALPAPAAEILASPQPITLDVPVQGAITNDQQYLTYSFSGQANDLISIDMRAISGNLDTLILLIDSAGNIVNANDDASFFTTDSLIADLRLVKNDIYTIVATRYGKELGGTEGEFELLFTGPSAALPDEVLFLNLPDGAIEISLTWSTDADMQLLVRDPVGDSVFDDRPIVPSGGVLAADGNVNCIRMEGTPVSYIYWPRGFLRPGTYEIDVWYQAECGDSRPVEFTLTVVVNDEVVFVDRILPLPNSNYVRSFTVDTAGNVTAGPGGFVGGSETVDFAPALSLALPITYGQTVSGTINNGNYFNLYTFEGTAGDRVTISMEATSLTLDTKLLLLSPAGLQVAENDDAVPNVTTNSLIDGFLLPETGTYTIIATRYATGFGGTAGTYDLRLTRN